MSSEQSLDPHLIEQTKQQIRTLVNEIARFAKSPDMAPGEFYAEFLPRIVSALAANSGVIWARDDQGRLALQYQVNLQETRLAGQPEEEQLRHGRLLHKVLAGGEGALVPPHSGFGDEDQAANPTDYLLVLGPLKTELEIVGVVEVFQRPEAGPSTQKGYLRFLLQMCDLAGDFLKSRQLRHFSDRQVLWTQLEEFTRLVHASLHPRATAYTIANEGRRLIECDRVSVAVRKGNRCVVEAVSGQDLFDKRSNTVRLLNRLATVVVASGEPVWYSGDTRDMAPQVEDAIQEYVDESHTKALAVIPLRRPVFVEKEKERPDDPDESPPPVGALIVEQIEDSRVAPKMIQRVDVVAQHSSVAMANAMEHETLFLMPLWRTLGKTRVLARARTLPKILLGVAALVALIVALCVVPADFKVSSPGAVLPIERRDVFAEVDGAVEKVEVSHGDVVQKGQRLILMHNFGLSVELTQVQGELRKTYETIEKLQRQVFDPELNSDRDSQSPGRGVAELRGLLASEKARRDGLMRQREVLLKQMQDLEVRSPVEGQVITWDPVSKLNGRYVKRGDVLLRLADLEKPWQLELRMPEDRIAHIRRAQNALYASLRDRLLLALRESLREPVRDRLREQLQVEMAALPPDAMPEPKPEVAQEPKPEVAPEPKPAGDSKGQEDLDRRVEASLEEELDREVEARLSKIPDRQLKQELYDLTGEEMEDRLPVQFVLSSAPSVKHHGWIQEIHMSAEVHGEEGNTVKIKVAFDKEKIEREHLRHGTTVTAKVACGRRALGYVLLHDLSAWAQKMWFRWF